MELKIDDLKLSTAEMYKSCFDDNGDPKDAKVLEWQFFNNGAENFVDIAFDEEAGKTAAIYATFTVPFKIKENYCLGSQSLDTITDVNYRGKGLFINLAKDVYHKAAEGKVKLVYGFPNGNSIKGFEKKLEWKVLDPLPFLIKPLRTGYFTKKIKSLSFLPDFPVSLKTGYQPHPDYIIEELSNFPESCDALWKSFSSSVGVAVNRDHDYLTWRYLKKPGENYRIAHCHDRQNNYLGFIVFTVKEKHGGKIGYIMELIYEPNASKAGDQLLAYAVNVIKKSKADAILAWCLEHSLPYATYRKSLFLNMPERLRPIELHFGARAFDDNLKEVIENRKNWYLSYSDSDTV